eukprot:COSAG01_NODE_4908_length_4635_cov_2.867725_4_plen_335_part_00
MADATARAAAQILGCAVVAVLVLAVLVTLCRVRWRPIRARGPGTLVFGMLGGIVFTLSALVPLEMEATPFGEGSAVLWQLWIPIVCGFGLWLASTLVYLRAMVQIHIFHVVPLHSTLHICFALAPWCTAAITASNMVALTTIVLSWFYILLLATQIWPLRHDLRDVVAHAFCAAAAGAVASHTLWVVQGGKVGDIYLDSGSDDPNHALAAAYATAAIVLLHWLTTAGKLLYLALCHPHDKEILKMYHDEYAPIKGSWRDSMQSFDSQVRAQRDAMPERRQHSFRHSRVASAVREQSRLALPRLLVAFDWDFAVRRSVLVKKLKGAMPMLAEARR